MQNNDENLLKMSLEPIYQSYEALEHFLALIRWRREQRRWAQARLQFLEEASRRVEQEIQLAQEAEDEEALRELQRVFNRFQALLCQQQEALQFPSLSLLLQSETLSLAEEAPLTDTGLKVPSTTPEGEIPEKLLEPSSDLPMVEEIETELVIPQEPSDAAEVPLATGLASSISAEEFQRRTAEIEQKWKTLSANIPQNSASDLDFWFEVRALACEINALYVLGVDLVDKQSASRLSQLQDHMAYVREVEGDCEQSFPFDIWNTLEHKVQDVSAEDWAHLARCFRLAGEAHKALEWWEKHRHEIHPEEQKKFLDYTAAGQQALFRFLQQYSGFDKLQERLYKTIQSYADKEGYYLQSLTTTITLMALEKRANKLRDMLSEWQARLNQQQRDKEREALQQRTLDALLQFTQAYSQNAHGPETYKEDQQLLLPLLDACRNAAIPPSRKEISQALICCIPLLQGQPKYSDFLKYATQRAQKMAQESKEQNADDASPTETLPINPEMDSWCKALLHQTEGKKLLIIGGARKYHKVCEELRQRLKLTEAKWLTCERNTIPSKYQAEIRNSDILMLVLKHVSHGMSEQARKWVEEAGGRYISLTGGFGLKQIVHSLFENLCVQN